MASHEKTIWGIHGGKTGDADSLFLKKKFIALGWHKCGNLGDLPADRDAFKELVLKSYPDNKPASIPNNAGQLYRFVHEMKTDDLIVYPSKRDHTVHIGQSQGRTNTTPTSKGAILISALWSG